MTTYGRLEHKITIQARNVGIVNQGRIYSIHFIYIKLKKTKNEMCAFKGCRVNNHQLENTGNQKWFGVIMNQQSRVCLWGLRSAHGFLSLTL